MKTLTIILITIAILGVLSTVYAEPPVPINVKKQDTPTWLTARAVLRDKLIVRGTYGMYRAKRMKPRCVLAQASYYNTKYYAGTWRLAVSKAWLIDANRQLKACRNKK